MYIHTYIYSCIYILSMLVITIIRRICVYLGPNWSEGSPRILKETFEVIVFNSANEASARVNASSSRNVPHTPCKLQWWSSALNASGSRNVLSIRMMMIAFITFKSSLVPLFEGLWSSNSWEFEVSGCRRNRTDEFKSIGIWFLGV